MKKITTSRSFLSAVSNNTGLKKYRIVTRMAFLVMAITLTTFATVAHAGLIVEEGFNYPAGLLNGSQAGGFGLNGNWGTNLNGIHSINASGLGFVTTRTGFTSGSLCTNGAACLAMTYGCSGTRTLSRSMSGATFYMSMVINMNGTVESTRTGFEFRHNSGSADGNLYGRVNGGWGIFLGPNGDTGISYTGGSWSTWKGVTAAADNKPHLIVYKLDFQANCVKMWVDPTPGMLEPTPSATLSTGNGWTVNLTNAVLDSIRAYNQTNSTSYLDEFRVGTTWADVTFAGPTTINAGGTYSGNWKSLDMNTTAVQFSTSSAVTINNSCIVSRGRGIQANANLTVQNTYGLGLNPNVYGQIKGYFIAAAGPANLVISNCHIEGWGNGVYVNGYSGNYDGLYNTIKIKNNRFVNMDSRFSNGGNGYLTSYASDGINTYDHAASHDLCLQNVRNQSTGVGVPGVEVAWNEFIKVPYSSAGEDVIDLYESMGTSASNILVHDNFIFGAYPADPLTTAYHVYSGGGIMVGEGSDLAVNAGYAHVYNNQVVATLNYGIQNEYGNNNLISNNRVVTSGYLQNGAWTPNAGGGLLMTNGASQTSLYYYNNIFTSNTCGYVETENGGTTPQDEYASPNAWSSYNIGSNNNPYVNYINNTWWTANGGMPTVNDENAEYNTWLTKLAGTQIDIQNTLPSPMQTMDIGTVASSGSASYSGGIYTVAGSGLGFVGQTSDAGFRYVYKSEQGIAVTISAKVNSVSYTTQYAQAGLVIRDSTYPGAVFSGIFVTPGAGVVFKCRTTAGTVSADTQTLNGLTPPIWLQLTRNGSTFTASYSTDGSNYTPLNITQTITMSSNTLAGLAVSSNADGCLCTGTFSNVTLP